MSSVHAEPPPPIVSEPHGTNYATGSALGKGGFAICHRAERFEGSKPTGQMFALKIVKSKMEPAKLAQKFVTELQIHSKLNHPNIVTFYRAFSFQTSTYVVLELCSNGSLADMLKRRKCLTLPEIRRFVIHICGAVKYLHHRHIVHRDLKTGNLFLDSNMNVKVGDFGLAALLVTEKEMEVKRRTTMCGTPNYLAPEILEKGKGHSEKVDLWAIGVIAYTLAVGKAPFHASSKEEIYKKLKVGDYSWPELKATNNNISADLRDLVSTLLVPEELRPNPDKIVSHPFFKIAFVPTSIPSTAREKAPSWPNVGMPTAETHRKGYSDSWWEICKASGVGEYSEGKRFPLNSGKRVRSIVHDMVAEEQMGTVPTMPIKKDEVYKSPLNTFPGEVCEEEAQEVRKAQSGGLREISQNEVASQRPMHARGARDADLMPPPSRPAGRTGTIRKAGRTISEETAAKTSETHRVQPDGPLDGLRVPKTRTGTTFAPKTLKESSVSSNSQSQGSSESKPQRIGTVKRSADASLARRPKPTARRERAPSASRQDPLATLDELKKTSPVKRARKKPADAEVIEILSDPESDKEKQKTQKPETAESATLSLPPPPQMSKRLPVPRKASESVSPPASTNCLQGTDPPSVLSRLKTLHHNLGLALRNSTRLPKTDPAEAENLPFVTRWVDYSRKHGVGYVAEDGTVGIIINESNRTEYQPVTHVVVRSGAKWIERVNTKTFQGMERIPFEISEDLGEEGVVRKVYKGLGSVKTGVDDDPLAGHLSAEAERRHTMGILWIKFARYMCQTLNGEERSNRPSAASATASTHPARAHNFIRFYQRLGNPGIWGFADGSLQVHFPDHTKLVLGADGLHVSATLLSASACTHLATRSDLLAEHVNDREVHADSTAALLHGGERSRQKLVVANLLQRKLEFVHGIVGQWVRNGGLGRLDGGGDGEEAGKVWWEGPAVKACARNLETITVGRSGGDGRL
ncbi:hypothetical protein MBLNU230_g6611t1 [Neophaeotheca triangularis]